MASGGGGTESGEPEFQIAPMIDVLLVLLIFFMSITTAEILKVDASITLPVSPNAKPHDAKMTKLEVAINVRWDVQTNKAAILVEDKEYPNPADLLPYLKARKEANPKLRAVIRGDKLLPAIEIQRVMNLVGEGGIADIAFSASNK
ncbi:MAG: biopolymer transporter ExbD [Verrucomicrobia bacterium]|nr:biopolymer transporter ExbD [Verrucomicrobiota bacterium]